MANFVVRKQLELMLSWKIGIQMDFGVSVGKSAKYMHRWLNEVEYQSYLDTYFCGNADDAWRGVFVMCDLFESTAKQVAERMGYSYNHSEGKAARGFLEHVKELPIAAKEIY